MMQLAQHSPYRSFFEALLIAVPLSLVKCPPKMRLKRLLQTVDR
jgi:hypothetical protein